MIRFDSDEETFCRVNAEQIFVLYEDEYVPFSDFVSPDFGWSFFDEEGPITLYKGDVPSELSEYVVNGCCTLYIASDNHKIFKAICCLCSPYDVLEIVGWSAKLQDKPVTVNMGEVNTVEMSEFNDDMWCRSRSNVEVLEKRIELGYR